MLLIVPEIQGLAETCKETSFMKDLDQKIIFDHYQQVFESDYQGKTSDFTIDQKFLFKDLKAHAMNLQIKTLQAQVKYLLQLNKVDPSKITAEGHQ